MGWHIRGRAYACCSCQVGCPCASGGSETTGSDGCSAVQIMEIADGVIDGLDVSRTTVAAVVDWPGPMMVGNGTGRLYFDESASPEQRDALRAVLGGKLGGAFSRVPVLIPKYLPPVVASIRLTSTPQGMAVVVGEFGEAIVKPLVLPNGQTPTLQGPGGFRDNLSLATGHGSWWRDPDLRSWQGGGYAEQKEFHFAG